jgi:hypothetical protein
MKVFVPGFEKAQNLTKMFSNPCPTGMAAPSVARDLTMRLQQRMLHGLGQEAEQRTWGSLLPILAYINPVGTQNTTEVPAPSCPEKHGNISGLRYEGLRKKSSAKTPKNLCLQ